MGHRMAVVSDGLWASWWSEGNPSPCLWFDSNRKQEENLTMVLPCSRWISMSLGFKTRSGKAFVCESSCLPLGTMLQNQNAALSKIFFIIMQIAYDLMG